MPLEASSPGPRVAAAEPGDERATVVPEFDAEAFARDSEVRLRSVPEIGSEPTIDRARQLHRDGEHEQDMDERPHRVPAHQAQRPEDDQNDRNGP